MAQFGRALGSGPRGRQFKSVRPDQYIMKKQAHAYYSGHVQGVGFRFTAERLAQESGIVGWVRNLSDGRVELVAEASEETLKDFLTQLSSIFSRYIQQAQVDWGPATGEGNDFGVKF